MGVSYYELLGISVTADTQQVKEAFRRLAKAAHPDAGGNAEAFGQIQQAYAVLSDPVKREQYDWEKAHHRTERSYKPPPSPPPPTFTEPFHRPPPQRPSEPSITDTLWPITWGAPPTNSVGHNGATITAQIIQKEVHNPGICVFHGVKQIDHVIVMGNVLIIIISEQWPPGRYETHIRQEQRLGTRKDGAQYYYIHQTITHYRNGTPFPLPHISAIQADIQRLTKTIRWTGHIFTVLAVSPTTSTHTPPDLTRFSLPDVETIHSVDLAGYLDHMWKTTGGESTTPRPLKRLRRQCNDPDISTTPYPRSVNIPSIPVPPPHVKLSPRWKWLFPIGALLIWGYYLYNLYILWAHPNIAPHSYIAYAPVIYLTTIVVSAVALTLPLRILSAESRDLLSIYAITQRKPHIIVPNIFAFVIGPIMYGILILSRSIRPPHPYPSYLTFLPIIVVAVASILSISLLSLTYCLLHKIYAEITMAQNPDQYWQRAIQGLCDGSPNLLPLNIITIAHAGGEQILNYLEDLSGHSVDLKVRAWAIAAHAQISAQRA